MTGARCHFSHGVPVTDRDARGRSHESQSGKATKDLLYIGTNKLNDEASTNKSFRKVRESMVGFNLNGGELGKPYN